MYAYNETYSMNTPPSSALNPHEQGSTKIKKPSFLSQFQRVSSIEKILFSQHLGLMLKGAIPVSRALGILADQTKKVRFQMILRDIQKTVEQGQSLSDGMSRYPKVFGPIFVSMMKAGESSGTLEETLKILTLQAKKEHQLISKIKGALTYPVIVLIMMIVIGIGMIVFIIPKITAVFEEVNAKLPLPTKILISISEFITHNGIASLLIVIMICAGIGIILKQPWGKKLFHTLSLRMPIAGPIVKKVNIARFARNFSSLMQANLPITQALQLTGDTLKNILYKNAIISLESSITKGTPLAEAMKQFPLVFPATITEITHVGEETGKLDTTLAELAEFYEEDLEQIMHNLPSVLEPVLMLLLGVSVGGMAVAIIMPMYSL